MGLNEGQIQVGDSGARRQISYGTQSPTADATPLPWNVGDLRINVLADPTAIGWKCQVAGTPGTWVEIFLPRFDVTIQKQFEFNTTPQNAGSAYWPVNTDFYAAAATNDWEFKGEAPTFPLLIPLGDWNPPAAGRGFVIVDVYVRASVWSGGNQADAILFEVVDEAGTVIGSGTINAGAGGTGYFRVISVPGLTFTAAALTLRAHSSGAAGTATDFSLCATLSVGAADIT